MTTTAVALDRNLFWHITALIQKRIVAQTVIVLKVFKERSVDLVTRRVYEKYKDIIMLLSKFKFTFIQVNSNRIDISEASSLSKLITNNQGPIYSQSTPYRPINNINFVVKSVCSIVSNILYECSELVDSANFQKLVLL